MLPLEVSYGDGSPIDNETARDPARASGGDGDASLRRGDVLLLDNMLTAHGPALHGRPPVLVAMGNSYLDALGTSRGAARGRVKGLTMGERALGSASRCVTTRWTPTATSTTRTTCTTSRRPASRCSRASASGCPRCGSGVSHRRRRADDQVPRAGPTRRRPSRSPRISARSAARARCGSRKIREIASGRLVVTAEVTGAFTAETGRARPHPRGLRRHALGHRRPRRRRQASRAGLVIQRAGAPPDPAPRGRTSYNLAFAYALGAGVSMATYTIGARLGSSGTHPVLGTAIIGIAFL